MLIRTGSVRDLKSKSIPKTELKISGQEFQSHKPNQYFGIPVIIRFFLFRLGEGIHAEFVGLFHLIWD